MSQQLKNQLTGLLPDQQPPQPTPERPPTWETHVIIPLTQNVLGGLAVAGLCAVVTVGLGRYFLWRVIVDELALWSLLLGGFVAFVATVVRFFGDDLGIVTSAYRLGRRTADGQISALVAETEQLRRTVQALSRADAPLRGQELVETIRRALRDGEQLLGLAYGGQRISREQVAAYMPQRSWERAIQLLRAAGCLDAKSQLTEANLGLALQRLRAYAQQDLVRAQGAAGYRPGWFLATKRGKAGAQRSKS
jgi:hypothetical protein